MFRVLVVAPTPFFGDRGCHVRIYEEVRALAARGVACEIVTYPDGTNPPGLTVRRARRLPGVAVRPVGPGYTRPLVDVALAAAARAAARRFQPDVIHAHLHEGIAIGALLRRSFKVPLVADLQGSFAGELVDHGFLTGGRTGARLAERLERWLVRQPDCILASSSASFELLTAQGVDPARLVWFPDGADVDRFRPEPPDRALEASLGLTGKPTVVFLGLLTAYQGVDVILDAAPHVLRVVPDAHFLLMGYPNEDRYRELVRGKGLERAITIPGRIPYEQAARYLSIGVLAVSPKLSATEANGKLLNYMACGLPVVASDTPVNRELLGEHGVYAPPGDAAALGNAIAALLTDMARRERLGRELRARVERDFSWPALAGRLIDVYRELRPAAATTVDAARA